MGIKKLYLFISTNSSKNKTHKKYFGRFLNYKNDVTIKDAFINFLKELNPSVLIENLEAKKDREKLIRSGDYDCLVDTTRDNYGYYHKIVKEIKKPYIWI